MTPKELLTKNHLPETFEIKKRLPWGYIRNPENTKLAIPDFTALEAMDEVLDALDNGASSLRQGIIHLNGKGYDISLRGLQQIWEKYRPDSKIYAERKKKQLRKKRKEAEQAKTQLEKLANKEQRQLLKHKRKITNEKKKITFAQKRLAAMEGGVNHLQSQIAESKEILSNSVLTTEVDLEKINKSEQSIVFKPNPGPQTEFLSSSELEVLYGGAAGGGKSVALLADPIRYFKNKAFVGILFRRTSDELRELVWKSKEMYPSIKDFTGAVFREKQSEWVFPSGARFWLTYLDRDEDVLRYQGQAFSWIGFDELTQWPTPFPWNYLRSRLRTTDPELKSCLSMRASTNPGGPGHGWVKKMFVDPAPEKTAFWARDIDTNEILRDPETGEPLHQRKFIPALLKDNPYLADDGQYRKNLLSLGENQTRQLLEGDWSVADGAAFPEFRKNIHIVKPFEIPGSWKRFRAADYGYQSYSCVLWFAINPMNEQLVVYRELYVHKMTGEALAKTILELEKEERVAYGMLDSSVWHKRGEGPSIAEVMINRGCRWRPADRSPGSRVAGKNRLHELLKVNEATNEPGIVFFNTCRQVLSDLPIIPADPDGSDDIDDRYPSDHSYDALRYGIMSRPRSGEFTFTTPIYNVASPADQMFGY